jgi:hypothetical protein
MGLDSQQDGMWRVDINNNNKFHNKIRYKKCPWIVSTSFSLFLHYSRISDNKTMTFYRIIVIKSIVKNCTLFKFLETSINN